MSKKKPWKVDRFAETTAPMPIDILKKQAPKQKAKYKVKPLTRGKKLIGFWAEGHIPL